MGPYDRARAYTHGFLCRQVKIWPGTMDRVTVFFMSLERAGYVGFFEEPLKQSCIEEFVQLWLERYGKVEQAIGRGCQLLTQTIDSLEDIIWEENLQFRVLSGEQFTWVYVTQNRYVIETTGLAPAGGTCLCRDVLVNLPGCNEIIDEHENRRLDELEAEGLM